MVRPRTGFPTMNGLGLIGTNDGSGAGSFMVALEGPTSTGDEASPSPAPVHELRAHAMARAGPAQGALGRGEHRGVEPVVPAHRLGEPALNDGLPKRLLAVEDDQLEPLCRKLAIQLTCEVASGTRG